MRGFLANPPFKKISIFVTIIVSFTYNVLLDRDLDCTCKNVFWDCFKYMALPFFIFFFLILWTDKKIRNSCKYACKCRRINTKERAERPSEEAAEGSGPTEVTCCKSPRCRVCGLAVFRIVKAALVGSLWVVSALIDGNWFVCCKFDLPDSQTQLACKDKSNITAEDKAIIAELKNSSRFIGFIVLLVILLMAVLISACDCGCCEGSCGCCNGRIIYDELILKESEDVLMEVLNEAAKDGLKKRFEKRIKDKTWKECFNVVEEMIENSTEPELPEKNEEIERTREETGHDEAENENPRGANIHPPPCTDSAGPQGDRSSLQQEIHNVEDSPSSGYCLPEPTQTSQEDAKNERENIPEEREEDRSKGIQLHMGGIQQEKNKQEDSPSSGHCLPEPSKKNQKEPENKRADIPESRGEDGYKAKQHQVEVHAPPPTSSSAGAQGGGSPLPQEMQNLEDDENEGTNSSEGSEEDGSKGEEQQGEDNENSM